jgi:uncharacterized RDD family membrane protein YckC
MNSDVQAGTPDSPLIHTVYDGLTIELSPAPFWRRFLALAVDYGIVSAVTYVVSIVGVLLFAFLIGGSAAGSTLFGLNFKSWFGKFGIIVTVVLVILFLLAIFSLFHIYYIYFESKKGTTPGKKLFGLKVVSLNGGRLTMSQCIAREVFRYVDVFLFLPGLISWAVTTRRQRLGDLFAGTMVTWSENEEKSALFQYLTQESYQYLMELLKPREITKEEAERILQFAYPQFVLGRNETLSNLDLKIWAEFADTLFHQKAPPEISEEVKLRFIAELSFQHYHRP